MLSGGIWNSGKPDPWNPYRVLQEEQICQCGEPYLQRLCESLVYVISIKEIHQDHQGIYKKQRLWEEMKKKYILAGIILLMGLALLFATVGQKFSEKRREEVYQAMNEELLPLRVEKNRLTQRLDKLESSYGKLLQGMGTAEILFTDLDERIYEEIYPRMEEYGFTGLLAVSGTYYPGGDGCLERKQFEELLKAGWEWCVCWQRGDSIEDIEKVRERMSDFETGFSSALYFERNLYTKDYDESLSALGYRTVIHHGEGGLPLVTDDAEDRIWHPGAVGLQGQQPRFKLEDTVNLAGNIVFTVGFHEQEEMYRERTFLSMLEYLKDYVDRKDLMVLDMQQAREYFAQLAGGRESFSKLLEEQQQNLNEDIEEIEKEMDKIQMAYDRY